MYIGDVHLPLVTDESTSASRPTQENNYVGSKPTVSEFESSLESGDISFVLTPSAHDRTESLKEQADGAFSLTYRNVGENPINFLGKKGHLVVESSNVTRSSRANLREGSITVRYLPDSNYLPASKLVTEVISNDYSVTASGAMTLPASTTLVRSKDTPTSDIAFETANHTLTGEDGSTDIYATTASQFIYEYPTKYTTGIRDNCTKVFTHSGSLTDTARIYTSESSDSIIIQNGFIRVVWNDPSDSNVHVYWHDGTNWVDAGTLSIGACYGVKEVGYLKSVVYGDNWELELRAGWPMARLNISGITSLTLDTSVGDYPISSKYDDVDSSDTVSYMTGGNANISSDYFMVKPVTEGTKTADTTADTMKFTSLTSSTEYSLFVGMKDGSMTDSDFNQWSLTELNRQPELIQRKTT